VHFGEIPRWETCSACDICGSEPEWLSAPAATATTKRRKTKPAKPARGRREQPHAAAPQVSGQPRRQVSAAGPRPANLDPELREYLRHWRMETAKEQGVPAFVVMHDTTLDGICEVQPNSIAALQQVSGIGERKAELYGSQILHALKNFLQGDRIAAPERKAKSALSPADETISLLAEGRSIDEIAKLRGRQRTTIVSMISDLVEHGEIKFQPAWVDREKQAAIEAACARLGLEKLSPLKAALGPHFTFEEIRLVVAHLRFEGGSREA
jgi:ATP-dependent DNA helicase RecQ